MSARRPLLLLGAGGFARETAEVVAALETVRPTWNLLGFCDDDPLLHGRRLEGVEVLGGMELAAAHPDAALAVCSGSPGNYFSRPRIVARLGLPAARYATLVHPAASVARSATLGPGTVVLAGAVLTAAVTVGAHVAVMPQVVLTHDTRVGDHATLAGGVQLAGGAEVAEGAYLGAGVLVREGRRVGRWSLVGMGSLVTHDVPDLEVWYGSPARYRRDVDAAHLQGAR